jgi:hypothetical protein
MTDLEPSDRPFQYSLWSLFVLTVLVAVVCSIWVSTDWTVPFIFIVGFAISSVGFGSLSYRKHPEAGYGLIIAGFFVRLIGLGIVAFGVVLWLGRAGRR